jgi:hypothetical protein
LADPSTGNAGAHPEPGQVQNEQTITRHHWCAEVEVVDGGYVLICACGWRSPAERSGALVGARWDAHLDTLG